MVLLGSQCVGQQLRSRGQPVPDRYDGSLCDASPVGCCPKRPVGQQQQGGHGGQRTQQGRRLPAAPPAGQIRGIHQLLSGRSGRKR
jgi:hypothetical protein